MTLLAVSDRSGGARRATGALRLVFRARGDRTILAVNDARAPLKTVRAFDLSDGRAVVQILTVAPGVLAGDAFELDVIVEPGARAVVLNQSATRVHRMPPGESAAQRVTIGVAASAHCEYYPGLTIPYPDADFSQCVHVSLAAESRFGMVESWAMGRVQRGEHLRFRRLRSRVAVDVEREPAYRDALELCPAPDGDARLDGAGVLEGHHYVAAGFWRGVPAGIAEAVDPFDGLLAEGWRNDGERFLRALSNDSVALHRLIRERVEAIGRSWGLSAIPFQRLTLG